MAWASYEISMVQYITCTFSEEAPVHRAKQNSQSLYFPGTFWSIFGFPGTNALFLTGPGLAFFLCFRPSLFEIFFFKYKLLRYLAPSRITALFSLVKGTRFLHLRSPYDCLLSLINRPGVAGAVLHTASLLIN